MKGGEEHLVDQTGNKRLSEQLLYSRLRLLKKQIGKEKLSIATRLSSQDVSADELFCRQLGEISGLTACVFRQDFNFPDINWEYHTAVTCRSWKFLKFVGDNFLSQVLSQLGKMSS